ncbi:MAG TPA: MBL fold metallo-hydrolase [Longimicrobiales bacterium]
MVRSGAPGTLPAGRRADRRRASPQCRDGVFHNALETHTLLPGTLWRTLRQHVRGRKHRVPKVAPPICARTGAEYAEPPASGLRATWLGHATILLEIDGRRLLFDPVWSERASPVRFAGPKRFHPPPLPLHEIPPLDAVVLSHDHYDHLDLRTIRALAATDVRFIAPLGVGAHLERWGVPVSRITELDWWDCVTLGPRPPATPPASGAHAAAADDLELVATPARHFSGRTPFSQNRTLWASWVVAGPRHRVYHSGDTGFDESFREIGSRYGPFDLTCMAIGAYSPTWPLIHMTPEEAVRAQALVRGRLLLPIHWGTFNLAFHAWNEPVERLLAAAAEQGTAIVVPRPGEWIEPAAPPAVAAWWRVGG